jgi:uncharacterized integral membrane protein (TIGR00698 family)
LGLGIIIIALILFSAGSSLKGIAIQPPNNWTNILTPLEHFGYNFQTFFFLFLAFCIIFALSVAIIGYKAANFILGFTIIFIVSTVIMMISSSKFFHTYSLEAPLVALIVGLLWGNLGQTPAWFNDALRTEYYIKTGIVLLGATLPLTLIVTAGPIAFLQATIVSIITWMTIFYAATRIFKLTPQFSAVLGAAGAVCGVSASIAVGGAVKAEKEQVAISISIVSLWALVMIFVLPFVSKILGLHPGVAGAWIGTSEFADAAGYAAAQTIASNTGSEAPIQAFTLMKVIGRDIWIGIWAFVLSIVSVVVWEKKSAGESKTGIGVIWQRFPKFVIGFFLASIIVSIVSAGYSAEEFDKVVKPLLINPIKTLRTWTFVFTFLCIGMTTRFKDISKFGMPPFWAFTIGVGVNVILGFVLSTIVFAGFWMAIH